MYLVYLSNVVVIGQRAKRIVVDAANASAMMAMSIVAMMRRKVREIICNDKVTSIINNVANFRKYICSCQQLMANWKASTAIAGFLLND